MPSTDCSSAADSPFARLSLGRAVLTGSSSVAAPAVFLMGPTATGKTDLALWLAERLPVDIVSVDSAMVYRGMDIGTGKPDPETLARFPHRLIDIRDPAEAYSAAEFACDAVREMADIDARRRIPLLVGGTGLYFRALREGLAPLPAADAAERARIDARAQREGWGALHQRLAALDPASARRIHPNDAQRIQRALEIVAVSGRPMSEFLEADAPSGLERPVVAIVLECTDREALATRIASRFRDMLDQGLVEEVRALYRRGDLSPTLPSIRAVGYRQVWRYLAGEADHETMVAQAITATRQLAKRQMTWFRREAEALRLDYASPKLREQVLRAFDERVSC